MAHITSRALEETGYVVLDRDDRAVDPAEWLGLTYKPWRSSGVTRFAPLTSALGDLECNAFWNHTPPRPDRDGVWIPSQVARAPSLARWAAELGADIGRCRVVELQPNTYADAVYNLHQDDNNRLNPDGAGRIVRAMLNLTDDAGSLLILRENRFDPGTEVRIPLPAGSRIVVDTQRLWHAVWHVGGAPRYCLITSVTSGPTLDAYVGAHHGLAHVDGPMLEEAMVEAAQGELHRRIEERRKALESAGRPVPLSWGAVE